MSRKILDSVALIRTREERNAGILDAARSDLPAAARIVWIALEFYANSERFWTIGEADICAEYSLSPKTFGKAIAELERRGIIRVEAPSTYHLLPRRATVASKSPPPNGGAAGEGRS